MTFKTSSELKIVKKWILSEISALLLSVCTYDTKNRVAKTFDFNEAIKQNRNDYCLQDLKEAEKIYNIVRKW